MCGFNYLIAGGCAEVEKALEGGEEAEAVVEAGVEIGGGGYTEAGAGGEEGGGLSVAKIRKEEEGGVAEEGRCVELKGRGDSRGDVEEALRVAAHGIVAAEGKLLRCDEIGGGGELAAGEEIEGKGAGEGEEVLEGEAGVGVVAAEERLCFEVGVEVGEGIAPLELAHGAIMGVEGGGVEKMHVVEHFVIESPLEFVAQAEGDLVAKRGLPIAPVGAVVGVMEGVSLCVGAEEVEEVAPGQRGQVGGCVRLKLRGAQRRCVLVGEGVIEMEGISPLESSKEADGARRFGACVVAARIGADRDPIAHGEFEIGLPFDKAGGEDEVAAAKGVAVEPSEVLFECAWVDRGPFFSAQLGQQFFGAKVAIALDCDIGNAALIDCHCDFVFFLKGNRDEDKGVILLCAKGIGFGAQNF